ncbi:vWA domain-containing protein [Chitinophaga sp. LS1]|uniref:vWA domain-containing protein n=1 Tax=Chitinophaga sp. LS1 TaxID=3051176 RepID=UPI002AAA7CF4|nr:vWA domain-containing protein [Chitinophaga sp. LS1]WPV67794.1 vWA domain-containing protein [Chitinophaga sp. LS1]
MAYKAEISRNNPSCFLFIIDQSGSMSDKYVSIGKPKSEALSDVINRMLQQLVIKCAKSEGVRDYYHVGVIGYGANGVGAAFSGNLAGKKLVPVSAIANNPARIEERTKKVSDGAGGLIDTTVKFPIWFDPTANGGTPMTEAFRQANIIISGWLREHPHCFPPVVIHITDGESTDGNPTDEMKKLTAQTSNDGNVILFNLHTHARSTNPISFPGPEAQLPDQYAEMLFNGASALPDFMRNVAGKEFGLNLSDGAKAFVLNGDIDLIITAIEIGTRPSLQLR